MSVNTDALDAAIAADPACAAARSIVRSYRAWPRLSDPSYADALELALIRLEDAEAAVIAAVADAAVAVRAERAA